jgi:ATP-binding cassette subfamily B protein
MLKKFVKYYKPYKLLFSLDLTAAFLVALCDLIYPVITRGMMNEYIPSGNVKAVIYCGLALTGVYLIRLAFYYFINYYGHLVGVYMQADMRKDLFAHYQRLPFSYFDKHETGELLSRLTNDLMDVCELAHHGPEDLFISIVTLVASFIYLCTINWQMTVVIFAFIPILLLFSIKLRKNMSKAFMESRKKIGFINAVAENSISGIRVARAFNNEKNEKNKFQNGNNQFVDARKLAYKAMAAFFSGTGFIISMLNVAVLVSGGICISKGLIDSGDFASFIILVNIFVTPLRSLVNFTEQYQNGMTGFRRFLEIMETPAESIDGRNESLKDVKGEIEFKNVSFDYGNGDVLHNVSFKVEAGKKIALAGSSGGGKTTVCQLIPCFYPINEGEIFIDGIPVSKIELSSLRENIGIVQQDVFLFSGTVKDNIEYGKPGATMEEIREAARKANVLEFVESLENGFDTQVGERGVRLSGGQKQRISIARAFLKDPKILILDEATSALDNVSERLIQSSLEELSVGRTTLTVAHRLSTIKNSDEIIVISDGKIIEKGTHEELLQKGGEYAQMASTL